MNRISLAVVVAVSCCASVAVAAPWPFTQGSPEVQEYVVCCITNLLRKSSIALMQKRTDEGQRLECVPMPYFYVWELGLPAFRCVEMLKGDPSVAGYSVCHLYATPRNALELQEITEWSDPPEPDDGSFAYVENGKIHHGKGKEIWRIKPPYDPYRTYWLEEFVVLMFLTPEHRLDMRRVKPDVSPWGTNTIAHVLGGADARKMSSAELMKRLELEHVFSNRVFRMNDGGMFQVDYPVPELEWRKRLMSKDEYARYVRGQQEGATCFMHLSSDEVSEIVWLAYRLDGDLKGFESACRRCPKILHPVDEVKTKIGRMVQDALMAAGRLQEMH